jgi:hypothetical protein
LLGIHVTLPFTFKNALQRSSGVAAFALGEKGVLCGESQRWITKSEREDTGETVASISEAKHPSKKIPLGGIFDIHIIV